MTYFRLLLNVTVRYDASIKSVGKISETQKAER